MSRAKKDWMKSAVKNKGGLHKALHVPKGQSIPKSKLQKATHSKNPHMKKMATLAQTFAKYRG